MLSQIFNLKNVNLVVGLITLLIVLWLLMFAIPSLFVSLFNTTLGNFILLGFIILAGMFDTKLALGLTAVLFLLFRFSHLSMSAASMFSKAKAKA
jgi:DNA-binding transcriptional regulator of glucitol operon